MTTGTHSDIEVTGRVFGSRMLADLVRGGMPTTRLAGEGRETDGTGKGIDLDLRRMILAELSALAAA